MKELKKVFESLNKMMKEMEARHETDIDSFYNLDEDVREELKGDWSSEELESYRYLSERITTIRQAITIVEEERLAEKFSQE